MVDAPPPPTQTPATEEQALVVSPAAVPGGTDSTGSTGNAPSAAGPTPLATFDGAATALKPPPPEIRLQGVHLWTPPEMEPTHPDPAPARFEEPEPPAPTELSVVPVETSHISLPEAVGSPAEGVAGTAAGVSQTAAAGAVAAVPAAFVNAMPAIGQTTVVTRPPPTFGAVAQTSPTNTNIVHIVSASAGPVEVWGPGLNRTTPRVHADIYADTGVVRILRSILAEIVRILVQIRDFLAYLWRLISQFFHTMVSATVVTPFGYGARATAEVTIFPGAVPAGLIPGLPTGPKGKNEPPQPPPFMDESKDKPAPFPGAGSARVGAAAGPARPFSVMASGGRAAEPELPVEKAVLVAKLIEKEVQDAGQLDDDNPLPSVLPEIGLPEEDRPTAERDPSGGESDGATESSADAEQHARGPAWQMFVGAITLLGCQFEQVFTRTGEAGARDDARQRRTDDLSARPGRRHRRRRP